MKLLKVAKNHLGEFYDPKLVKPTQQRKVSEEEHIAGTGVSALALRKALQPPPETYGSYSKKYAESSGAIAMIDLLSKDLATQMSAMTAEEKSAQDSYAKFMVDSAKKRAGDAALAEEKEAAKASLEAELEHMALRRGDATSETLASTKYLSTLHVECDWLIGNFDRRTEARTEEVDALKHAKAVLSGADYSFVQTGDSLSPRGALEVSR